MHLVGKALLAATLLTHSVATYGATHGIAPRGGATHMVARGMFEVKVRPADGTAFEQGAGIQRYELDKTWTGDFVGTSQGEMLATSTASTGSMAYVAMEQMTGTLQGRTGTFSFAHRATMTRGDAASGEMHVDVVKGSGTGQLAGIGGQLTIHIDSAGKHSYEFIYEIP